MKHYFKKEILLAAMLLLQSCGNDIESTSSSTSQTSESQSSSEIDVKATITCEDMLDVDIHTKKQASFIAGPLKDIGLYAAGGKELSKPKAVKISWTNDDSNVPFEYQRQFKGYKLFFYDNQEKNNPTIYDVGTDSEASVTNLFLDYTYYYEVKAYYGEYEFTSNLARLVTKDTLIRNLDVDGVTNVRDLGNYPTIYGKKVKQGMLYRSAKFNQNYSTTRLITSTGLDTVLNVMKLKTEIDLRNVYKSLDKPENNENGSLTASVLGESVTYKQIDYSYYCSTTFDDLYDSPNQNGAYRFFKTLADESNYPIDFHCSIGTDRTGYLAFLTLALLGVDRENIYRDYLFSNFGDIGSSRSDTSKLDDYLIKRLNDNLQGNTINEKVENYLLSINITKDDIANIRRILLED